jgi:hypothetical protein
MKKNTLYILVFAALGFSSCEQVIDLSLESSVSQVVVEGNITDLLEKQEVRISRSVAYDESNAYPAVTGAAVVVTDDAGGSWTFAETQPGTYSFPSFKGVPGHTYTLTVNANGRQYIATSTLPQQTTLDSISIKSFDFGGDDNRQVQVHYSDPAGVANQYRYVVKVNGKQEKAVYAENDRFTDGNHVTSVLFYPDDDDDNFKLKIGDTVEVEMQCIDKDVFTYWFTLMQQSQNGPGGGTIPGNPPSNLSNGALGYFSAHTSATKTLVVK